MWLLLVYELWKVVFGLHHGQELHLNCEHMIIIVRQSYTVHPVEMYTGIKISPKRTYTSLLAIYFVTPRQPWLGPNMSSDQP